MFFEIEKSVSSAGKLLAANIDNNRPVSTFLPSIQPPPDDEVDTYDATRLDAKKESAVGLLGIALGLGSQFGQ
jgi:hypothetical protein